MHSLKKNPPQVAIIGTGYVGLVTGVCLAEIGVHVICVDKDLSKINSLKKGVVPIYEPELEPCLHHNLARQTIDFTTDIACALTHSEIVFIAVDTPTDTHTHRADLSFVFQAAEEIGKAMTQYAVIVTKSTVPVGTNRRLKEKIRAVTQLPFDVASNPEFLREGSAVYDFMHPDRIIIGTETEKARDLMTRLYDPLCDDGIPRIRTTLETAEMIKYGANAFLATKIGFINALSDLCEHADADIRDVAKGIGMDQRIGRSFLHAGPGYGGSCFPKDTLALQKTFDNHGLSFKILNAVIDANDTRKKKMFQRIQKVCHNSVRGKVVGILGLTFKAHTDDIRNSPAMDVVSALLEAGAKVQAFDPQGMKAAKNLCPDLICMSSGEAVAQNANVVVVLTEWPDFLSLDLSAIKEQMKTPHILDFRNLFDPSKIQAHGFTYVPLGYKPPLERNVR